MLAPLPTPKASDSKHAGRTNSAGSHRSVAGMAMYGLLPTLSASYRSGHPVPVGPHGQKWQVGLQELARAGLITTPTVHGNYNRKGASPASGDGLATAMGGRLNPCFVEAIMGFPVGWTDVPLPANALPAKKPSATPSSRRPRKRPG